MRYASSDSKWLYGIHGPGGEHLMLRSGKAGWIMASVNVRTACSDRRKVDFRRYGLQNLGVVCILNDGDEVSAAIPADAELERFVEQCATTVAASRGCTIWVIGDEPNADKLAPTVQRSITKTIVRRTWRPAAPKPDHERRVAQIIPGVPPHEYAKCFHGCASAIHNLPGHENDAVLTAAIAPGVSDVRYAGNSSGDWVVYFRHVLDSLPPDACGGFALHASTHGADPQLVTSEETYEEPFSRLHREFRSYRDYLSIVPPQFEHLPAIITQADQGGPWFNANTGWVQAVYQDVDEWNRSADTQRVCAVALNGWDGDARCSIRDKNGVWQDFRSAMTQDYSWSDLSPRAWSPGTAIITTTDVHMCPTPSSVLSDDEQCIDMLPPYSHIVVDDRAPVWSEGRYWWHVQEADSIAQPRSGWIAETMASGDPLITVLPPNDRAHRAVQSKRIWPGDNVCAVSDVILRRTPGLQDKADNDIVTEAPAGTSLAVLAGPRTVDGLKWWLVRWQVGFFKRPTGWVADSTVDGKVMLRPSPNGAEVYRRDPNDENPAAAPVADDDLERYVPGDHAQVLASSKLRRTPGYKDKPRNDVLAMLNTDATIEIVAGPEVADALPWWHVTLLDTEPDSSAHAGANSAVDNESATLIRKATDSLSGWIPATGPNGEIVLSEPLTAECAFEVGDLAVTKKDSVHVRATPGIDGKADEDILGSLRIKTTVVIQSNVQRVDNIAWQRGGAIGINGEVVGWIAHENPEGDELIGRPNPLPGTTIPDAQIGAYLHTPYPEMTGISQLWGENSWYYKRYSYDGVPLLGHNGIDLSMKVGTPILAVDSGSVIISGFEKGGFGWHVLLSHSWGQSLYAHMDKLDVKTGQNVRRGQILGASGNSGGSTGPHLHFAIRIVPYKRGDGWGGYSDPLPYLNPNAYILPNYILDEQFQIYRAGMRPLYPRLDPSSMGPDTGGHNRP